MSELPGWLTVTEFGAAIRQYGIHIGDPTIRYHCRAGMLHQVAHDAGRMWYIPTTAVTAFVADYLNRMTRKGQLT